MTIYYTLTTEDPKGPVKRDNEDGTTSFIPADPANSDWIAYQDWVKKGNTPDPYVAPEPPPMTPTPEQQVLYDHENRLRSMEGQPPLTLDDFMKTKLGR